jgi:hypothetical protein
MPSRKFPKEYLIEFLLAPFITILNVIAKTQIKREEKAK